MKAEVITTVTLKDPQGTWVNSETTVYQDPRALTAFVIQRIAKIVGEGGVLEIKGEFEAEFIRYDRIEHIHVKGTPMLIDGSTDVNAAASESQAIKEVDQISRTGNVTPFRRVN